MFNNVLDHEEYSANFVLLGKKMCFNEDIYLS